MQELLVSSLLIVRREQWHVILLTVLVLFGVGETHLFDFSSEQLLHDPFQCQHRKHSTCMFFGVGNSFWKGLPVDNNYKRPLNLLILVGRLWEVQLSYIVVWGKSVATIAPSDSPVMSGLWIFPCTFLKQNNQTWSSIWCLTLPLSTPMFFIIVIFYFFSFQLYWSKSLLN